MDEQLVDDDQFLKTTLRYCSLSRMVEGTLVSTTLVCSSFRLLVEQCLLETMLAYCFLGRLVEDHPALTMLICCYPWEWRDIPLVSTLSCCILGWLHGYHLVVTMAYCYTLGRLVVENLADTMVLVCSSLGQVIEGPLLMTTLLFCHILHWLSRAIPWRLRYSVASGYRRHYYV